MKFQQYILPFFIASTAFCWAEVVFASDSLRCGGSLVSEGDTKARVMKICGAPYLEDNYCKPVRIIDREGNERDYYDLPCENIDTWTYDQGPGTFLKTVEFQRGKVVNIIYGPRS